MGQTSLYQPLLGRRARRKLTVCLAVMLVLVSGGSAAIAYRILQARVELVEGAREVNSAALLLRSDAILTDPVQRAHAAALLAGAEHRFRLARSSLALPEPVRYALSRLPRVGTLIGEAPAVAAAAYYATRSANEILAGTDGVWPHGGAQRATLPLSSITSALERHRREFAAAASDARHASYALQQLPTRSGSPELDSATADLRARLPTLATTAALLRAAPMILGAQHAAHYLVVIQDPRELRATGGFIGSSGYVTVRDGKLSSAFGGSALPHEIASISPPLPEAMYTPEAGWLFRDSNWSPDGPLSARLERWFYGRDTGRWADGVISLVDTSFPDLLQATGPVFVPQYGSWVDAGNVQRLGMQYVYGRYHGPLRSATADDLRKQFIGWLSAAIVRRLESLSLHRWASVTRVLEAAVAERNLYVYDGRPEVEAAIRRAGVDGSMRPQAGDYLAVVDDNRSYNKLNPYVRERVSYAVKIRTDLSLDSTLTIRYHVNPSPSNLEGFGPGWGWLGTKHDYQDFVRVYVPPGATLLSESGLDPWATESAYGLTQFAGRLLLRSGQSRTVVLHYRVPASAVGRLHAQMYRLTVRKQAGSTVPSITVGVYGDARILPGGALVRALGLSSDARFQVSLRTGSMPRVSPAPTYDDRDPYIDYDQFQNPRHSL